MNCFSSKKPISPALLIFDPMNQLSLSSTLLVLVLTFFAGSCANQSNTAEKEVVAENAEGQFEAIVLFVLPPFGMDTEEGRAAMASEKGAFKQWMNTIQKVIDASGIESQTTDQSTITIAGSKGSNSTFDLSHLGYSKGVALLRAGAQPKYLEGMVSASELEKEIKLYFGK